jgi:hypothetical protein
MLQLPLNVLCLAPETRAASVRAPNMEQTWLVKFDLSLSFLEQWRQLETRFFFDNDNDSDTHCVILVSPSSSNANTSTYLSVCLAHTASTGRALKLFVT